MMRMYEAYFTTQEKANQFIEEANQLGYEWYPVSLYCGKTFVPGFDWVLEFDASPRVAGMLYRLMECSMP